MEIIYLRGSIFLVHRTSSNRTLQNAPYCGWQCVWRLSLCQGSVTLLWCHSRVLWQSPDTTLMSCFYVSARLRVCSSCACFVSCWSVVFGSQHSCLEFQFRVGFLVMLRSWTSRSFWTNLLDERIVLVHVIHWFIFLVHWNPSLHSSAALFALRPVSSCQRLTNPRANSLRVWDAAEHVICWIFWTNTPFTDRFAFESDSERERSRSWTSRINW